ncbi:hypothetical protein CGZ93_05850 [Enemella dayhoffiae]|uniref:Uncharacterized protein n=1 Tax=Enemella dayhoffiae TaxID=2016507 RepID=A0A255H764_9ACTN|nr:hypothetical protein [Enemella dayhoffiae]OYO23465.1 hypothetical protein CGZ93_05850 [Enemella dayhoffiae]
MTEVALIAPEGVRLPAGLSRVLDGHVPCQTCGSEIGARAALLVERAGEWMRFRPRHPDCAGPELVELPGPERLDPSRGVHRVGCVALPDQRPALLVNPDVDAPAFVGERPALADLLNGTGWQAWPATPQRISGWVEVRAGAVEVLTGLGSIVLDPVPEEWARLVGGAGELPVLALLDEHVDAWLGASGWAEVAALLDRSRPLAGLVQVLI